MDEKLVDFLWEEVTRLDEAIVDLGDALDVKASIVLVLATLLGAISGPILALHDLPAWVKVAQAIAVAALGFTVICALAALWPSQFALPSHVEAWEGYITESAADHKEDPDGLAQIKTELRESRVRVVKRRIADNQRITKRKGLFNKFAFYTSAVAILMDVATMMWLARTHL
jgi:hypothetical protein